METEILSVLNLNDSSEAITRSRDVILGGGLGPTEDDLTKETTAAVFGRSLYMDEHSKELIELYFKKLGPMAVIALSGIAGAVIWYLPILI